MKEVIIRGEKSEIRQVSVELIEVEIKEILIVNRIHYYPLIF